MNTTPPSPDIPEPSHTPNENRAELSIVALYLFFFTIWAAGYAWGVLEETPTIYLGLPAWFIVSCLISFGTVSLALIVTIKRYFS